MLTLISFIFLLLVLVFFHELGHFLAAKSVGMRVEKFYLGFNLFGMGISRKIGETEYGIGLFPLGGYVKVSGIIDESMDDSVSDAPWEYQAKNPLQQIWFASAGVIMNLLLAVLLFTVITLVVGVGEADPSTMVGEVMADYPAETAGIEQGAMITVVNGQAVSTWAEMTQIIHSQPNTALEISWEKDGVSYTDSLTSVSSTSFVDGELKDQGMIGIAPFVIVHDATISEALQKGVEQTGFWLAVTFFSVKELITGGASLKDIGGPVAIAKMTGEAARVGLLSLMGLMAIISVNLALLNILPIPGLDGGHIIVSLIEGISRRKLPVKVKLGILQAGLLFLMALFAIVLYNDLTRVF